MNVCTNLSNWFPASTGMVYITALFSPLNTPTLSIIQNCIWCATVGSGLISLYSSGFWVYKFSSSKFLLGLSYQGNAALIKLGEKCSRKWVCFHCLPLHCCSPCGHLVIFEMPNNFWLNINHYIRTNAELQMMFVFFQKGFIPFPPGSQNYVIPLALIMIWTWTQSKINHSHSFTSLRFSHLWNLEKTFCLSIFPMPSHGKFQTCWWLRYKLLYSSWSQDYYQNYQKYCK